MGLQGGQGGQGRPSLAVIAGQGRPGKADDAPLAWPAPAELDGERVSADVRAWIPVH